MACLAVQYNLLYGRIIGRSVLCGSRSMFNYLGKVYACCLLQPFQKTGGPF